MGRPPSQTTQRQLAVALPAETRSHLERAATAAGHSIAEEVRQRIDKTMHWDSFDPVTMELIEGLENISALLRRDFGAEWHADAGAFQAFLVALNQRLAAYEPLPNEEAAADESEFAFVEPTDPPETIGRMRERDDQRLNQYKHLLEAKQREAKLWEHRRKEAEDPSHRARRQENKK